MTDLAQLLANARNQGWSDWIRSEADERAVLEGCVFDLASAERVRTFFRQYLRHSKGDWAGKPFELLECSGSASSHPYSAGSAPTAHGGFDAATFRPRKKMVRAVFSVQPVCTY